MSSLKYNLKPTGIRSYPRFLTLEELQEHYKETHKEGLVGVDSIPRPTKIFLVKCDKHHLHYLDYNHGYKEETECPLCLRNRLKRR